MTNTKNTRRALLISVLTMTLSFVMLIGTTFAWFTDSVSSGKNKIVAGNLDVELEYAVFDDAGNVTWKSVEGVSLFDENALWEPGYTQVVYLKVRNAGTLALKYKLSVNAVKETSGISVKTNEEFNLSDFLVFGQAESNTFTTYATREEAWKAAGSTTGMNNYSKANTLTAGAEEYVALVVYMPTTVGDEANYRGDVIPTIEFDINLVATQVPSEKDSFGEDYDRLPALIQEGYVEVKTEENLKTALKNGEKIVLANDVELTSTLPLKNASFTLDGNGHTITQSDDCTNTWALFDISGGSATISNVTFDGIQGGAVIRTVYANLDMDNVNVENCQHTQTQGLLRLLGKSTITNSTFKNNDCTMVITLNYDASNNDPQVVKNCVFENNNCNGTGLLYYVNGAGATIDGNKFINNTVTSNNNAATVYMGFTENNVITNNLFSGNKVTTSSTTTNRATGGLMIGYEATITGNAFVDNTISVVGSDRKLGNDVCASVYYTDIDLSGNYWGGNAPEAGNDYFVEYSQHKVIINDYLTTYGN